MENPCEEERKPPSSSLTRNPLRPPANLMSRWASAPRPLGPHQSLKPPRETMPIAKAEAHTDAAPSTPAAPASTQMTEHDMPADPITAAKGDEAVVDVNEDRENNIAPQPSLTEAEPPTAHSPPSARDTTRLLDIDDLTRAAHEPDDPVYGPLEPGVIGLLIGAPGISKSTIALYIAVAVAAGVAFNGITPPQPQRVLVYSPEDTEQKIGRRLIAAVHALGADHDLVKRNLRFLTLANPARLLESTPEGHRRSEAGDSVVKKIIGFNARLVIFDPLVETHSAEESDNGAMHGVFSVYRTMCREAQCALLLTHHITKDALGKINLFSGRGAGSMAGTVRCIFAADSLNEKEFLAAKIQDVSPKAVFKLSLEKANYAPNGAEGRIYKRVDTDFGAFTAPVLHALN